MATNRKKIPAQLFDSIKVNISFSGDQKAQISKSIYLFLSYIFSTTKRRLKRTDLESGETINDQNQKNSSKLVKQSQQHEQKNRVESRSS